MGAARRGFLQIFLALTHGKISPEKSVKPHPASLLEKIMTLNRIFQRFATCLVSFILI